MKGGLLTRALNTVRNLFQRKQETDYRPGQRTIAALRSEVKAQQQRITERHEALPGHRTKGRSAGKTKCRCFARTVLTPSICQPRPRIDNKLFVHREAFCPKHRINICLDCGNRDRSTGVR